MIAMLIIMYLLYKKANQPVEVPKDPMVIEQLHQKVDSLVNANENLQIAYDNKQATIINNITYKNASDAKIISGISALNNHQRDSLWTILLTSKDSIPGRYWNILKQKTGGRSIKDLQVQGDIQK